MVSEVSGLADLIMVISAFVLNTFYTPFILKAKLLNHIGPVELQTTKEFASD